MKRLSAILILILVSGIFLLLPGKTFAFVSGTTGKIGLSPNVAALQTGTPTAVNVTFNTGNVAISSLQVVATFPVTNGDLQATVQPNSTLTNNGWTFAINKVTASGSTTTISLMALNVGGSGYSTNTNTTLATISFTANSAFTGKVVTLSQSQTEMLKKSDASDMAGSLTNGTYTATGSTINTPTPTQTNAPTPTPTTAAGSTSTPTPTVIPGQNAVPTCVSLTSDTSAAASPVTVTLTCSGSDSDGDITAAAFTFGDGASQTIEQNVGGSGSLSTTHTYTTIGAVRASCLVRDNNNAYSQSTTNCQQLITLSQAAGGTPVPTSAQSFTYSNSLSNTDGIPMPGSANSFTTASETGPTTTPEEAVAPIVAAQETTGSPSSKRIWLILGGIIAVVAAGGFFLFLKNKSNQPKNIPPVNPPVMTETPNNPVNPPTDTPTQPPVAS